jgi:hypothetical protein
MSPYFVRSLVEIGLWKARLRAKSSPRTDSKKYPTIIWVVVSDSVHEGFIEQRELWKRAPIPEISAFPSPQRALHISLLQASRSVKSKPVVLLSSWT